MGRRARCPDCGREPIVPKADVNPYDAPEFLEEVEPRTSGKAVASLVLGLLSFLYTLFTGVPAIILGALGLSDINRRRGRIRGRGMAITGIVCGGIGSTLVVFPLKRVFPLHRDDFPRAIAFPDPPGHVRRHSLPRAAEGTPCTGEGSSALLRM